MTCGTGTVCLGDCKLCHGVPATHVWHALSLSQQLSAAYYAATTSTWVATDCFAVAEFEAESEEEVSVSVGDEIIVHIEVEGWFQITRVADHTRGLVPASYVQVS